MKTRKHIATIIFIVLLFLASIGMGVGVYTFYNQLQELQPKLAQEAKNIADKQKEIDKTVVDIGSLKQIIGCPPGMRKDFVFSVVEGDIQKVSGEDAMISLPLQDNEKVYEIIIKKLFEMLQDQKAELGQRQEELEKLKLANLFREQNNDKLIVAEIEASKKAQAELLDKLMQTSSTLFAVNDATTQIAGNLDTIFKDNEVAFVDTTEKLGEARQRVNELKEIHSDLTKVATRVSKKSLSHPDGRILAYNPATKIGIISLGSNSNLRVQTSFEIYPANATANTATPKGTIVVQKVGETQSRGLVSEFKTTDPILVGDIIFTKDWTPGDHKRYALCGFMDINADGKNDVGRLVSHIEHHGDVCDAYLNGSATYGMIVPEINYCVLGDRPDEAKFPAEAKAFDAFLAQVKRYNIPQISVSELMRQIGIQGSTVPNNANAQQRTKSSTPSYGVSRGKDNTFRSRNGSRVMPR